MAPGYDLRTRDESSSLVNAVRVLRERWWLVALTFVGCILVSLVLSKRATTEYEASAQLLIGQQGNLGTVINPNAPQQTSSDPARDQGTALLLVTSPAVADRVRAALKDPAPSSSLSAEVTVSAEPDANLLSVTATDPDPARAQRLADAFATQYAAFRKETARAAVTEGVIQLRQQRDALSPDNVAQRQTINLALQNIIAIGAVIQGDAQVVSRAALPTSPSAPRTKRDAILAAILGLVAGVGLVFILDLFDRRLKTPEEFEQAFGTKALAMVPLQRATAADLREHDGLLEPYRILNSSLSYLAEDHRVHVLLVTSAMPGEGKSTIAAGLARAAAQSGQRVVLVEADLRRPTFQTRFDIKGDRRGLSTALVGGVEPASLLRTPEADLPLMKILPAGPTAHHSAELLRSRTMSDILETLLKDADLIILDAPPLLPVADSQSLLDNPAVDATLVVGRIAKTRRDEARRSRSILDRHGESNLGLVVNGARMGDGAYEYYGPAEPVKRRLVRRRA